MLSVLAGHALPPSDLPRRLSPGLVPPIGWAPWHLRTVALDRRLSLCASGSGIWVVQAGAVNQSILLEHNSLQGQLIADEN